MYYIKGKEATEEEYLYYAARDLRCKLYVDLIKVAMVVSIALSGCILIESILK